MDETISDRVKDSVASEEVPSTNKSLNANVLRKLLETAAQESES